VSVSADITGLTPSTTYHFRAVATNTLGIANGSDTTFTTTPPVAIDSESATNVTDSSATLTAQVNPEGLDTTCQFQYVDDATFKSSGFTNALLAPPKPVDVGSGTSDVATSVDLTGLHPSTKYHFRVVCKNAAGTEAGPDRTFTTFASGLPTGLPDNRGYEMVTPPNKDNGEPFLRSGPFGPLQAATDGNALSWVSLDALPGSQFDGSFYLSKRGSSSWVSQNLIPPQATELGLLCALASPEMFAYTGDLSKGILADGGSLIGTCGADVPPLVPGEPRGAQNLFVRNNTNGTYQLVDVTPSGVTPANATYDASSADMSHVVFDESAQLTSNAPAGADNLYEWSGGSVRLVTLLPGETPVVGSLAGGAAGSAFHAVSDDGARVFFTANGNLYERENGSTTAQIDASQGSGPGGGGQFLAATADGLTVFFTDDASAGLTSDTVAGSGANLYRYSNGHLTDLTPVGQAQVAGLSGITGDGSYLYFVANGSLASGATAGQPNMYLLHNGTMTFIATLSGNDSCDWSSTSLCARVSSNGKFLAFTSTNSLTGYDNNGQPEIFRYDASANSVVCASCIPSGVPATGGARVNSPYTPLLSQSSEYLQRYVSDSGQVFFDTPDSLTPRDTNGQQDVYEYENGQVRLISGGTSVDPSWFIDSSPSGSDVFFGTSQQLVAQDTDGAMDFYDARVGGGFPASAPPPTCVGEGCKPPLSGTPGVPVIASVTFFGPGNVKGKHVARVVVLRKTVKGTTIRLRIRVPGAGQITISGRGLRTVSRSVRHAGTFTLTVHLTAKARAKLRQRHRLRLTISVRFVPAGAGGSTAKIKLTVKA
jgi:hypothetical protein